MSPRILPLDVLRNMKALSLALAIFLLLSASGKAQQTQQAPQAPPGPQEGAPLDATPSRQEPPQAPAQNSAPLTLPAGTQLALVLTHPIDSKATRRGDTVFAETTAPVFADDQVVIPAGAFVQAKVEKLSRRGSRADLLMQSVSVALPDGSVVNIKGPVEVTSGEGTALRNPGNTAKVLALVAPFVGSGLGTAIGEAAHTTETTTFAGMTMTSQTLKGVTIGGITGLAGGTIVSFVLMARTRHFYVGEGSPLEMVLWHPVTLARGPADNTTRITAQP